jgi:hypothetical protein
VQSLNELKSKLRTGDCAADNVELYALATMLNTPIYVHDTMTKIWVCCAHLLLISILYIFVVSISSTP